MSCIFFSCYPCSVTKKVRPLEDEKKIISIGQNIEYNQKKTFILEYLKYKIKNYTVLSIDDILYIQKMDKLYLLHLCTFKTPT